MDRRHRSRSPLFHQRLNTDGDESYTRSPSVRRASEQEWLPESSYSHDRHENRDWNDRSQARRLDHQERDLVIQISRKNPTNQRSVGYRGTNSSDERFRSQPYRGPPSSQSRVDFRSRSRERWHHLEGRKWHSPDRDFSFGKPCDRSYLERGSRRSGQYLRAGNKRRGNPERDSSFESEQSLLCGFDAHDRKRETPGAISGSVSTSLPEEQGVLIQEKTNSTSPANKRKESDTEKSNQEENDTNQNGGKQTFVLDSILPGIEDIGPASKPPRLDKNIVKGVYKDPFHYLDTQFGLLREDLIGPLRSCIKQYTSGASNRRDISKLDDGYCYTGVRLHDFEPRSRGIGCRVKFDTRLLGRIRWLNSKRLLQGNLVCLSADNFDTFFCATVDERRPEDLCRGELVVLLLSEEFNMLDRRKLWVMIEATSYYEAYRHVLARLQDLGRSLESERKLPFQKQLVFCEPSQEPGYLKDKNVQFDVLDSSDHGGSLRKRGTGTDLTGSSSQSALSSICESLVHEFKTMRSSLVFQPQEVEKWKGLKDIGLDDSQIAALQNIMTNELSVIQGPPGTGKSFIGLCFVRVLLANKSIWKRGFGDHIMIVCYTNHALDQFLEGVVDSGSRASMVRVGGGSKSETLKPYMIWNKRKQVHQDRGLIRHLKTEITNLNTKLAKHVAINSLRPAEYTIQELILSIPSIHAQDLLKSGYDLASAIIVWLAGAKLHDAQSGRYKRVLEEAYKVEDTHTSFTNNREAGSGSALRDEFYLWEEDVRQLQSERDMGEDDWLTDHMKERHEPVYGADRPILPPSSVRWRLNHTDPLPAEGAEQIKDVWGLSEDSRCRLYLHWCAIAMETKNTEAKSTFEVLQKRYKQLDVLHLQNDLMVLRNSEIIGLTTTGAAKYHQLIQKVKPRIVIVEEAAEVLEAHIVTALTEECEHLVLIGDHKQLRPNPTMYKLARDYNLDVSLFERLVRNDMTVSTLEYQHRMRPEISQFLVPHIYEQLRDHEIVKSYDHVRGVKGDVVFLNHSVNEAQQDDSHSHTNQHEAALAVGLCEYLLKQEYEPSQITVLAMYTGQMIQIRRLLYSAEIKDIRVSAVDSFQGEENDIIILSCVRSNGAGKIGFLKAPNRICVSLSRARMGFYAVGNFTMYAEKSKVWRNIVDDVKSKGLLKNHITLYCPKHDKETEIEKGDDYKKVRYGGCSEPCYAKLNCGHLCYRDCHVDDAEHKKYRCKKPCERKCEKGHKACRKKCMERCSPCDAFISVTKPGCGHVYKAKCSRENEPCTKLVEKLLDCGHKGTFRCSRVEKDVPRHKCKKPCQRKCKNNHITMCKRKCFETCTHCIAAVEVKKAECEHVYKTACYKEGDACPMPCQRIMECGHACKIECGRPCSESLCTQLCERKCRNGHRNCTELCYMACPPCSENVFVKKEKCGHSFKTECFKEDHPCPRPVERVLDCGHKCGMSLCGSPGFTSCEEPVQIERPCGHSSVVPCCKRTLPLPSCDKPCLKTLSCGHWCRLACGRPCMEGEPCSITERGPLPCGHVAHVPCSMIHKLSSFVCRESIPKKLPCGHVMRFKCCENTADISCTERCERKLPCGHFEMVKCSDDLKKIKCLAITTRKLPCGHNKFVECYLDHETVKCDENVTKELPCGHEVKMLCGEDPAAVKCRRHCHREEDMGGDETHHKDAVESGLEG